MASEEPPPSPPKSPGDAETDSPPKAKALRLGDLTEMATLELLFRLDMAGLATVRQVCRRLHRIASDASLLARVSVVAWNGDELEVTKEVLTNCAQLGTVQMPEEAEAAGKKFLAILEWLLKGGAKKTLVTLQTPWSKKTDGNVLPDLSALLTKHEVELKSLSCCEERYTAFLELLRSQPTIAHLWLSDWAGWKETGERLDAAEAGEVVRCLPSLRHLSLMESNPCGDTTDIWAEPGLPTALGPQLRSVLVVDTQPRGGHRPDVNIVAGIRQASAGRLLLQAVGKVTSYEEGFSYIECIFFAVADFRAEERDRRFLLEEVGLWDPWLDASEAVPEPTLDDGVIEPFLHELARRQVEAEERQELEKLQRQVEAEEQRKKKEEWRCSIL